MSTIPPVLLRSPQAFQWQHILYNRGMRKQVPAYLVALFQNTSQKFLQRPSQMKGVTPIYFSIEYQIFLEAEAIYRLIQDRLSQGLCYSEEHPSSKTFVSHVVDTSLLRHYSLKTDSIATHVVKAMLKEFWPKTSLLVTSTLKDQVEVLKISAWRKGSLVQVHEDLLAFAKETPF